MQMKTEFLAFLRPARDKFFVEGDAAAALQLVQPHLWKRGYSEQERRPVFELAGLVYRHMGRYADAIKLYKEIGDDYQAGYCEMLTGNLPGTVHYWTKVLQKRQNHWCVSLYGLITRQLNAYPTMFQIRNHIESDIGNLIRANQAQYLENMLSYAGFLSQINLETPKFIGRGLMNSGWLDRSGPYLMQGQKTIPNDPEIYYHLGQYHVLRNNPEDAVILLNQCLLITPSYQPAKELLKSISQA